MLKRLRGAMGVYGRLLATRNYYVSMMLFFKKKKRGRATYIFNIFIKIVLSCIAHMSQNHKEGN